MTQTIENLLSKMDLSEVSDKQLLELLLNISVGNRVAIDPRTHQRVVRKVTVLNYIYLSAQILQNIPVNQLTEDILDHLTGVQEELEIVWGKMELERFRLADLPLSQLETSTKSQFEEQVGKDRFAELETLKVDSLLPEESEKLIAVQGKRLQNEIFRHILVSVISELWVDYLTQVDALRVSIGLEAYAQRDPLVQYKGKAAEMFRNLLSEIRVGVISRMFRYQPRRASTSASPDRNAQVPPASQAAPESPVDSSAGSKKKRKRH